MYPLRRVRICMVILRFEVEARRAIEPAEPELSTWHHPDGEGDGAERDGDRQDPHGYPLLLWGHRRGRLSSTAMSDVKMQPAAGGEAAARQFLHQPALGLRPGRALVIRNHRGEALAQLALAAPGRFEGQARTGEQVSLAR
jgi:hypothetical protein